MKLLVQQNTRLEHRLQVPMTKAITLPLVIDGHESREFVLYLCTNAFAADQPPDQTVQRVARIIAGAINSNHQGLKGARA